MFLLSLLVLASAMPYQQYLVEFDKNYATPEDIDVHHQAYLAKLATIHHSNTLNLTYTLGINNFTDWTDAQLRAFLTVKVEVADQIGQLRTEPRVGGPTSLDWRSLGKVTSVKNQGTCGACWAFSSATVYESLILIVKNSTVDLSQQYLLECTNLSMNNCQGGRVNQAMMKLSSSGCPPQSAYPYLGSRSGQTTPSTPGICSSSANIMLSNTMKVSAYRNLSVPDIKFLLESSPVAVLVDSRGAFMQYSSGVFGCTNTSESNLDHAVVLVGYTLTTFIVKNSWGTAWGEQGYMQLNQTDDCGARYWVYVMTPGQVPNVKTSYLSSVCGICILLGLLLIL